MTKVAPIPICMDSAIPRIRPRPGREPCQHGPRAGKSAVRLGSSLDEAGAAPVSRLTWLEPEPEAAEQVAGTPPPWAGG